jgi:hypothetical protein
MKPRVFRLVAHVSNQGGHYCSMPAEVGVTAPQRPPRPTRRWEHPEVGSATVSSGFPPERPGNDANLAIG